MFSDHEVEFIGHVWQTLDDERLFQELKQSELADRLGIQRSYFKRERRLQINLTLATVAKLAHAMGKRVRIVLEDEVKE